jgi:hypothetical protein
LWNQVFQDNRWDTSRPTSELTLRHTFYCSWEHYRPGFFRVTDDITLRESNAVFALSGRTFRKPVTLLDQDGLATLGQREDKIDERVEMYIDADLEEFVDEELSLGFSDAKDIPPAPLRIAAGTASPDTPAARIGPHRLDPWERKWEAPWIPVAQYTAAQARRGRMILEGTVSRVALQGNFPQRLTIYFKESPDNSVTVCTPSPDIFVEFGTGYRGLVGRTLEAAGDIDGRCTPNGGVFVAQSNQFRVRGTDTYVP